MSDAAIVVALGGAATTLLFIGLGLVWAFVTWPWHWVRTRRGRHRK